METKRKIVANLGKNGIGTVWAAVICTYLAAINVISVYFEDLYIAGLIPEMVLWCWLCNRLLSEQKIKEDMCILILIYYGMSLLLNVLSFFIETDMFYLSSVALILAFVMYIMMWIRYDGAMKKYAIWSIVSFVGCLAVSLIFGDPAEMGSTGMDRVIKKYLVFPLLIWPYTVLYDVLREEDGDEDSDENDSEDVSVDEA